MRRRSKVRWLEAEHVAGDGGRPRRRGRARPGADVARHCRAAARRCAERSCPAPRCAWRTLLRCCCCRPSAAARRRGAPAARRRAAAAAAAAAATRWCGGCSCATQRCGCSAVRRVHLHGVAARLRLGAALLLLRLLLGGVASAAARRRCAASARCREIMQTACRHRRCAGLVRVRGCEDAQIEDAPSKSMAHPMSAAVRHKQATTAPLGDHATTAAAPPSQHATLPASHTPTLQHVALGRAPVRL